MPGIICSLNCRDIVKRAMQEADRREFEPDLRAAHLVNTITNEMVEFEIVNKLRAIRNEFSLTPPFESQRAKDALFEVASLLQQIEELNELQKAKMNLRIPGQLNSQS